MQHDPPPPPKPPRKRRRMTDAELRSVLDRLRERNTALTEDEKDDLRAVYPLIWAIHFDTAWKQAERRGVPSDDRGDVANTAMARLFKSLCDKGLSGNLAERARSATDGAVSNYRRVAMRRGVSAPVPSSGSEKPRSSERSVSRKIADRELALRLFAQLSPEHQEIVRLRLIEEMSDEEAAQALDVPLGTAKSRLRRAQQMIDSLAKQFVTESERSRM